MDSLDSIAEDCGTISESQEQDDHDRVHSDDVGDLDNQSGDYEVETGW